MITVIVMVAQELVKWIGWTGHLVIKASKITCADICVEKNQTVAMDNCKSPSSQNTRQCFCSESFSNLRYVLVQTH